MKTIKIIFFYFFFGLSFLARGQQIGNYVNNGSFEAVTTTTFNPFDAVQFWTPINAGNCNGTYLRAKALGSVPIGFGGYQYPRTGDNFVGCTFYCAPPSCPSGDGSRMYPRNLLKDTLKAGVAYCAKYHVVNTNNCIIAIDRFGIYLGDNEIDTIKKCQIALSFLNPQIENQNGIITDTLNWVAVSGTFVATGNERYMVLGNFRSNPATNTLLINPTFLPDRATDVLIDDVSLIEVNLPAYAGKDTSIYLGDSLFIGRQSDFAIDPSCIWYKLPNMTTSLDTISGIWVKPTTTSTYVVRQVLDCSPLKWDTVVVTVSTNFVGLDKLQNLSDNISLFPNPTSGNLSISGFIGSDNTTFSISNCLGQNVLNGDINQKNNLIIIETSELESGLYQIHLKTQFGIVTKKFVKTN